MRLLVILFLLSFEQLAAQPAYFVPLKKSEVPRRLLQATCQELGDCRARFARLGEAWVGDVNHDGEKEIIVFPGTGGTGGSDAALCQRRGESWARLLDYFPYDTRFLILSKVRDGYSDLCLDDHHCFKWNGKQYVGYEPADYRQLPWSELDTRNPREATLRWMYRYAALRSFHFEPDWYEVSPHSDLGASLGLGKSENRVWTAIEDKALGLRWVSLYKAGVWAVKGKRAFLILPRSAHVGTENLAIEDDWLIMRNHTGGGTEEVARYNRRTRELLITDLNPFWLHPINE